MNDDGFINYKGDGRSPIRGTQGAVARLRSGEVVVIPPSDSDELDPDEEMIWEHVGDERDILSYKVLSLPCADALARAATAYLEYETWGAENPLLGPDTLRLSLLRQDLVTAIENYKRVWPDWPDLSSLRRLRQEGDL